MSVSLGSNLPEITVEMGLSTAASGFAAWNASLFDAGAWGPDAVWVEVSAFVKSATTTVGRQRETDRYGGRMTLVLSNRDARFTPANLAGPYVVAGVSQVRPMVPVRVTATWSGATYPVFYGYAESWQDEFPSQGMDAVTVVSCVDALSTLARVDGAAQPLQGGGESTGQRMHRILNGAGWTLPRDIDFGIVTVQGTTLDANAMAEAMVTADSEGGWFWADPDGTFVFRERTSIMERTRSTTVQAALGTGSLPCRDIVVESGTDVLLNVASYARVGGAVVTAIDETSRALYGTFRTSRGDLVSYSDGQVADLALWDVARYRNAEYRPVRATLDPALSPAAMWPVALGAKIKDRVSVTLTVSASSTTAVFASFIEGVTHSITPGAWSTTFAFSSATPYGVLVRSTWNASTWDSATWFY
jgi:hypothetical protein